MRIPEAMPPLPLQRRSKIVGQPSGMQAEADRGLQPAGCCVPEICFPIPFGGRVCHCPGPSSDLCPF